MGFRTGSYWKIVAKDGYSIYEHKFNPGDVESGRALRFTPGRVCGVGPLSPLDDVKPRLCTADVIHASPSILDALRYTGQAPSYCYPLQCLEIVGTPVVGSPRVHDKHGFRELKVVRRLKQREIRELLARQAWHAEIYTTWGRRVVLVAPPPDDVIERLVRGVFSAGSPRVDVRRRTSWIWAGHYSPDPATGARRYVQRVNR